MSLAVGNLSDRHSKTVVKAVQTSGLVEVAASGLASRLAN
jgi:hypothetical protein